MTLNIVYENGKELIKVVWNQQRTCITKSPQPRTLNSIFVFALLWFFLKPKFPSTCLEDLLKSLSKSSTHWSIFEE